MRISSSLRRADTNSLKGDPYWALPSLDIICIMEFCMKTFGKSEGGLMNLARRRTRQWVPSEHTSPPPKAYHPINFFLGVQLCHRFVITMRKIGILDAGVEKRQTEQAGAVKAGVNRPSPTLCSDSVCINTDTFFDLVCKPSKFCSAPNSSWCCSRCRCHPIFECWSG